MRSITVTVGPLAAASANNVAQSQTPVAGPLTLNGASVVNGTAVLDMPRRILITTAANESANVFTITGTNASGNPISETIAGPNIETAQSVLDYATVSRITVSANASGAVTVGTSGVASSAWVALDEWALPETAIQIVVSGTVNYSVQSTLDNPNGTMLASGTFTGMPPALINWFNSSDAGVVNATASAQSNFAYVPRLARVILNSGTGSVVATFSQAGSVVK